MDKTGRYEYLEHTADVYIAAHGKTLIEAFENAALAMFEAMTDTNKVGQIEKETVEVEAEDEYALLYNWLETLLVKFETKNTLFSKFCISSFEENNDGFKIKATAWGEKFDPKKHVQKVAVKAATYHRMEIIQEIEKATVEFILDI